MDKMNKLLFMAILCSFLGACAASSGSNNFAQMPSFFASRPASALQCEDFSLFVKKIFTEKKLGALSTSVDDLGNVYMFFLNNRTGDWLVLGIDPDVKKACILIEGTDWDFILERGG